MKLINCRFELGLPFEYFRNLGCVRRDIGMYKAWELEHTYYAGTLIDLDIQFGIREDHAGLSVSLGLLGYGIRFAVYDTRHWDYKQGTYVHNQYF